MNGTFSLCKDGLHLYFSLFFLNDLKKKIYSHLVLFTEEMAKQVQKLCIWHSHMQRSLLMSASGLPKPVFTPLLCD